MVNDLVLKPLSATTNKIGEKINKRRNQYREAKTHKNFLINIDKATYVVGVLAMFLTFT